MFELTKSQKQIQKAAKGFAKGEFDKELAYEFEKSGTFPEKIWKQAAELGFVGLHFPEKYSGGDMGMLEAVLVLEEFCRKDASIGNALAMASFASECLLTFGSDELKKRFLPSVAEGEIMSAGAFSESRRGLNADVHSKKKNLAPWTRSETVGSAVKDVFGAGSNTPLGLKPKP